MADGRNGRRRGVWRTVLILVLIILGIYLIFILQRV